VAAAAATALAIAFTGALPAGAGAIAPPGPPPGAGAFLPASPGTVPAFVPPGSTAALPAGTARPGLLSAAPVAFNRARRTFALPLACQASGTASASGAGVGALGRARYRCAGNRAVARFAVAAATARKIVRRKTVTVTATIRQGGTSKVWFTLRAGGGAAPPAGFWTDGHLQCTQGGANQAFLAEPDFTTVTPTTISTRGWIAWYTPAGGWRWFGTLGDNAGRWETWTAAPNGVVQFHPGGAATPTPWTWGPISIPSGQGIAVAGVYEIVYWVGGRPTYRWQYVNAGATGAVAAGGGTPFCVYP
jgi:hypothetical protein